MSAQTCQYLIYGVQLDPKSYPDFEQTENWPFEDCRDSAFSKELPTHIDGITPLHDGMNGEYYVVGKVVAKARDEHYLAENGPLALPKLSRKVKQEVAAGLLKHFGVSTKPEFFFITMFR